MRTKFHYLFIALVLFAGANRAAAQDSAFTYQGRLNSGGSPASGTYNLTFYLYNANTGGAAIAGPVTNNGVIVTNGLFTVPIDFGPGAFTGTTNWLQIGVATDGVTSFTALSPRQQLTPTPYAIYAESGGAAQSLASGVAIGSGSGNTVPTGDSDSFIGGGLNNTIQTGVSHANISGGDSNTIQIGGNESFIGGGTGNSIQNNSPEGAILGGSSNTIGNNSDHAIVGGGQNNSIQTNAYQSTIAGGYQNTIQPGAQYAIIAGGLQNTVQNNDYDSFIGGGFQNTIGTNANASAIAGGWQNVIQTNANSSFIGGGANNTIQPNADHSNIGGGNDNTNGASYATVPGGANNLAGGEYSFAAGQRAKALHQGAFVWADSQAADFASTTNDQFSVRAQGGVQFVTSGAGVTVDGQPVAKSYGAAISSAPFTVTQPGSYYLTTNINVSTGDAIDIDTNDVTLDLNGFTISGTTTNTTGNAIYLALANGNTDITIVNGHILSGITNKITISKNGTVSISGGGTGFEYGIFHSGSPYNIRVSGISVSGCLNGIMLNETNSTLVESCVVQDGFATGINADSVSHCTVYGPFDVGIRGGIVTDCSVFAFQDSIIANIANSCWVSFGNEFITNKYNMP